MQFISKIDDIMESQVFLEFTTVIGGGYYST